MKIVRHLGEARRAVLFDEREKCRKAGEQRVCSASVWFAGERAGRASCFFSLKTAGGRPALLRSSRMVEIFLKPRSLDVETEDLRSEGVLLGQVFRAFDAPLPWGEGHRVIMGLRLAASNPFTTGERSHGGEERGKKRNS